MKYMGIFHDRAIFIIYDSDNIYVSKDWCLFKSPSDAIYTKDMQYEKFSYESIESIQRSNSQVTFIEIERIEYDYLSETFAEYFI